MSDQPAFTHPQFSVGDKVLVTTDNWFLAPNGDQYRAVWGTVKGIHSDEATLGMRTNVRSTNWYVEIGNLLVAGCQIHYAVRTDACNFGEVSAWKDGEAGQPIVRYSRPSTIYNADAA